MPQPSPLRPTRSKQESMTITRTVGKALADVMNKDNASLKSSNITPSNESDMIKIPAETRNLAFGKTAPSSAKNAYRASRTSVDSQSRSSDSRSTPQPAKRSTVVLSPSKPTTRSRSSMGPPLSPISKDKTMASKTASKPRASLSLRGLSSALQSKATQQPSSLPKYKLSQSSEPGRRKRQSVWDVGTVNKPDTSDDATSTSENDDVDGDDDADAKLKPPLSPLPCKAAPTRHLPVVAVSLTPSTPPKKGVLQRVSDRLSSNSPSTKAPKVSPSPVLRLRTRAPVSRPSSIASNSSRRASPVQDTREVAHVSKPKITDSICSSKRRPTVPETPPPADANLAPSPPTPIQLSAASGGSLLSPPLSPSLGDVSLDSIDAGDVSALLQTVVSPIKPTSTRLRPAEDVLNDSRILSDFQRTCPPQTPASQRCLSILSTDPRQSVLSLREYLESSGDVDHLLSQPLPSLFSPEARERVLSFGFSPEAVPPPFSFIAGRPEPQTPSPVPGGHGFTSISQVLFPSCNDLKKDQEESSDPVEKTVSREGRLLEYDARVEDLEKQLALSQESRERETAGLRTQLTDLERKLNNILVEKELEMAARIEEFETRLRTKDEEWSQQMALTVEQAQGQNLVEQQRMLSEERRKRRIGDASATWDHVREVASSELALLHSNKEFVAITLAGLELSMEHLRMELDC